MRRLSVVILAVCLTIPAWAADWKKGSWQGVSQGVEFVLEVESVNQSSVIASFSWSANGGLLGQVNAEFPFVDNKKQSIRVNNPDSEGSYLEFKISGTGRVFATSVDTQQPDRNLRVALAPAEVARPTLANYSVEQALNDLPSAERWLQYINEDLWPFWGTAQAMEFVSSRCNDGSLPDLKSLCRELNAGWIREGLGLDYTRMVSRQTYLYGVIYNLTGNQQALDAMNNGVEILLSRFEDSGSVATVLKNGKPLYRDTQRTAQDLAYVQVGLAMAYYLTGNAELLQSIDRLKDYIIEVYYREDWGMLAWTLEDQQRGDSKNQELVSQLDQLNAYMLLVYPHLPEDMKQEWEKDIRLMVDILIDQFLIAEQNRFAGQIVNGKPNRPGDRHNDFGHSVKSFWMIYTAGQLLDEPEYVELGRQGIEHITAEAIRFGRGPNGSSNWGNQSYSSGSAWWEFAELNQATATLALEDLKLARYLPGTYQMWLDAYVDHDLGGVFGDAGGGAKQHLWKNGYHEAEQALVAVITTQAMLEQTLTLYFARTDGHFQPYLYSAEIQTVIADDHHSQVVFTWEK